MYKSVIGVTVSEYYEMIRLPVILRTLLPLVVASYLLKGDSRVSPACGRQASS